MNARTAEQVDGWPSQPFSGGYGGLHELAGSDFSGAVSANGAWLFMLNGHAIGVADGPLEAFDGASGTAYSAPDDALPLLFAMLERGGEKRGQYYTERTALSDVDRTLAQGGFTGYVELSENVLSGDYYVVYYGGNAMHAAFVGQADRLLTGEEAAERANDEVGLYDVVAVDLSILDLPEPAGGADEAVGVASPASNGTGGESTPDDRSGDAAEGPPIDEPTADDRSDAATGARASEPSPAGSEPTDLDLESALTGGADPSSSSESAPEEAAPGDDSTTPGRPESAPDPEESAAASDPDDRRTSSGDSTDEAVAASLDDVDLDGERSDPTDANDADEAGRPDSADATGPDGSEAPVPPTDPPVASESSDLTPAVNEAADADTADAGDVAVDPVEEPADETTAGAEPGRAEAVEDEPGDDAPDATEFDDLFTKYENDAEEEFASAAGAFPGGAVDDDRLAELEAENERLAEERDELAAERDRLESRIAELDAEGAGSTPSDDFEQVAPETALEATDLFVRYASKSAETLDAAHEGADNQEAVRGNLDIEHHTRFDAARTAVGDQEYEAFLPATLEHELVTWLVADLLYEIRDTGHAEGLRPLYDALPRIDRADLHGSVDVGEESVEFDVVCRDRLGNPLVCADVHESRDPATDAEMDAVLEKSARVGEVHDEFACAFLVTSSFFEPNALELATERTASGGLFGGSKRESFVKLSRKRGYHLCLVEARDRRFHLTLPEL